MSLAMGLHCSLVTRHHSQLVLCSAAHWKACFSVSNTGNRGTRLCSVVISGQFIFCKVCPSLEKQTNNCLSWLRVWFLHVLIENCASIRRMWCAIGIPQVARQIYDHVYLAHSLLRIQSSTARFSEQNTLRLARYIIWLPHDICGLNLRDHYFTYSGVSRGVLRVL